MICSKGNYTPQRWLRKLKFFAVAAAAFCVLANAVVAKAIAKGDDTPSPGGTIIYNRADATYEDAEGLIYSVISQTVSVTVLQVPAVVVTPDETSPSATVAPNDRVTRLFRICNGGNAEDAFVPVRADVTQPASIFRIYLDIDGSGTVTSGDTTVVLGETVTPRMPTGGCIGVLFEIDTNAITPQTEIAMHLTARSNAATPGSTTFPQDLGTIINSVGNGVVLTSPSNTNLPPLKLVENEPRTVAQPTQVLNYSIAFRNNGSVNARQVRVLDDLPTELVYVADTLKLNGHQLTDVADGDEGTATDRRIELLIPEVGPDAVTTIQFKARLTGAGNGNGVVNFAHVSAANAPAVNTSNAVAVVNPIGSVYAGNSLGSVRISGAQITLAADSTGAPLPLVPDTGYEPNPANTNPFTSDGSGNFSFNLSPTQIGGTGTPVHYMMSVTAAGYRPRQIDVAVEPSVGGFYTANIQALDGQPVAVASGFALSQTTVHIADLAALVFNIPMFELSTLEISKTSDKRIAEIGDLVSYRLTVKNSSASAMTNVTVEDVLPTAFVYADGTARIENGSQTTEVEPNVAGNRLTFNIGALDAGATATISYRVRIGANANEGEHVNLAIASGVQPNGTRITTQPATAVVAVKSGTFSMRQIVVGRVFEDKNGNGKFDAGERPVAGARVYSNNGQSVVTDEKGNYNLPAISAGSFVLSLDPVTLPDGYRLLDDRGRRSANSWTRLLRTPLGGGALLRQNFAIAPKDDSVSVADDQKVISGKGVFTAKVKQPTKASDKRAPVQIASRDPKNLGLASTKTSETYTLETTETIEAVAPGELALLSPKAETLVMQPALSLVTRVAKDWTVELNVNGEKVGAGNIGETRLDNRNKVTTYSFVGISLKPGSNNVRLTPVGPDGTAGKTTEVNVFGRGPAEKVEIVPAKSTAASKAIEIEIRATDRWGNPAQDGQISIETSAGQIFVERDLDKAAETENNLSKQQLVQLVDGKATVQLIADGVADKARLKVVTGSRENFADVRFETEMRPTLMVGLAEISVGSNAPEISNAGDDAKYRGRLAFYYRGRVFGDNLLTLAYDSRQALNRIAGRDRFGGFDPMDRAYPIFGDSSVRFEDAQSNSKIYARIDRGLSYAMFGDMDADLEESTLTGYARRLTGVKLHLENKNGDMISVTGARPDTAFARDVIPGGGLSIVRLSHADVLQGSEVVALETRDRRNPEIILSRETLVRSVDYNLDPLTGELFFLRSIPAFDLHLNILQIVVAYEHRGTGAGNSVYTGRAVKQFRAAGLKFGASFVEQQQSEIGAFRLGGLEAEKTLWNGGKLTSEFAMSNGRFASGVNVFDFLGGGFTQTDDAAREHNGTAFSMKLTQPLPFFHSNLKADFARSTADYFNPFGATVAPGTQRLQVNLEMRPSSRRSFLLGFTDERNRTSTVDNSRRTLSLIWSEQWRDNLRTTLGFDNRRLEDAVSDKQTDSNLVTAAVEYKPIEKMELSVKREQNLTSADPTYPDQTTFAAKYQVGSFAKLFFTQRLASAAITPIGDVTGGFGSSAAKHETAFGVESKFARIGAVTGRYQIENGVNGQDNFAVIGLQNTWKVSEHFAVEAGGERGFLVRGADKSFISGSIGGEWLPVDGFRTSFRYEVRNRNGFGQLVNLGAAGKIGDNWTTLVRGQFTASQFNQRKASASSLTGAAAYRPLNSDKYALLFSYNHRQTFQDGSVVNNIRQAALCDRSDTLSTDGLYEVNRDLEVYGRFALRFNANGSTTDAYASSLTYLGQARLQQRIGDSLDFAVEGRWLASPSSSTFRRSAGTELGYWLMPDLRLGLGYNLSQSGRSGTLLPTDARQFRGGFYFTLTSKMSNIFNLFGTAKQSLRSAPDQAAGK